MPPRTKAVTLFEIILVIIIISVLATIALVPFHYAQDKFARNCLRMAWQSEKDFFAFSYRGSTDMLGGSSETFTSDWSKLFCGDLNARDKQFTYTIEEATSTALRIKAEDRRRPGHYFVIDKNGVITDAKGRVYIIDARGKERIQ